jgi:hypothetical protein
MTHPNASQHIPNNQIPTKPAPEGVDTTIRQMVDRIAERFNPIVVYERDGL